jgi:Icc-related predicted phosphoesterase
VKILIFSDIHGDTRALQKLLARPADLYISAGDLCTFGRGLEGIGEIFQPLGEKVWVLPGNHETEQQNHDFCGRYGLIDIHRQVKQAGDFMWAGLGYSNPTPFDTPGEYSEEEIGEALMELEGQLQKSARLILVAHFPPYGTRLDQVAPGKHAGSPTLRAWVERIQPAYLFCGHIHECAGRSDRIGLTQCFNVGKNGHLLEIPDSPAK